ncbi:unnamed protein product [Plutella xylostella]|uniref:(diamondback moth) hypothetical protein n=1 Tax=Plutella xylostella TaxID=51655 RepID=A0A8S4DGV7_PLUXY|nr:unnamed protein product [Plutella xylostella]
MIGYLAGARFVHDPLAQSFLVWEFTIHEDYNKESVFSNDIAVVMISGEFQFGPNVQRAVLMDHNKLRNKKNFRVAGYGKTKYNQQPFENTKFMKTTLQYVKKKRCLRLIQEKLGPHVFCLGGSKKGRDTCQGDSGAGVLWQNLTVGMVSFGIGCGVKPGVYVRVFNFRSWLLTAAARLASAYCQHARG